MRQALQALQAQKEAYAYAKLGAAKKSQRWTGSTVHDAANASTSDRPGAIGLPSRVCRIRGYTSNGPNCFARHVGPHAAGKEQPGHGTHGLISAPGEQ